MKRATRIITLILALITALLLCSCEYFNELTKDKENDIKAAIYEADIESLRNAIQEGALSCHDLTQYYLERIEKYNEEYNCFITMCDDALEVADSRDAELKAGKGKGLLFGIPVVIKDNTDYKGYETTNGYEKGSGYIATKNANVVEKILNEGAIIIGKTNMSTEAQSAADSFSEAIGDTRNAYNKACSPGGSSGGSAAAVSLNFAAAALGTDTNSSLRIPAALNGDVALRSSFGLVNREGVVELNPIRDVVGAITRNVIDQAIMMDALTGKKYSYYDKLKQVSADSLKTMKFGIVKELTESKYVEEAGYTVNEEAIKIFDDARKELEDLGAELVEVSLPIFEYNKKCQDNDSEYSRREYMEIFKQLMKENKLSALIYPGFITNEMYLDQPETMDFFGSCKYISPILGLPDISVQIGCLSSGVGVGMSIVTDKGADSTALEIAYLYSNKYNHRIAPTGAPNLYKSSSGKSLAELSEPTIFEKIFK